MTPDPTHGLPIETKFDSNYRKVMVAARRARQIQSGASPLVRSQSNKACRLAQEEIQAGKIAYVHVGPPLEKPTLEDPGIPILAV
jgi:DNA-directed RNA polymerase subunit omega